MSKHLMAAGLLVALAAPAFAQTSSTTTTTTTGGTTTEEYYVVRDPSTKKCTVTTTRPTGGTTVQVGGVTYKSRGDADTAVTKVCTD